MDDALQGMEPEAVWRHFSQIAAIPRCSHHEERILTHLKECADTWGLSWDQDTAGNLVIRKPAAPGYEQNPVVVLQGHVDMVCEKNRDTTHDFANDGIRLYRDGEWLAAQGTTLGADNGIAVAMMLALLEGGVATGALECLFTVDEESGLTGALQIDPALIRGRRMINLDSEEEGFFCIGCAGGVNTHITLPVVRVQRGEGTIVREVFISHLHGGHSGAEIHMERGNSIVCMARFLQMLRTSVPDATIAEIEGGGKHNAIPREVRAVVVVPTSAEQLLQELTQRSQEIFRRELQDRDPEVTVELSPAEAVDEVLGSSAIATLVDLLLSLPNGVLGTSPTVAGLVETSSNVAAISTSPEGISILTSQRSSGAELIDWAGERAAAPARLAGAQVRHTDKYPGWAPSRNNPLLDQAIAAYRRRFEKEPEVGAFHAGLECGVIRDRVGEMDMISFGPDLIHPHTPEERLSIPSTERTWKLLVDILQTSEAG